MMEGTGFSLDFGLSLQLCLPWISPHGAATPDHLCSPLLLWLGLAAFPHVSLLSTTPSLSSVEGSS